MKLDCNITVDPFNDVSIQIDAIIRDYVDWRSKAAGVDRRVVAAEAGKALIFAGCSFLGNAIGLTDPDLGLKPARDCLDLFERLAREKIASN